VTVSRDQVPRQLDDVSGLQRFLAFTGTRPGDQPPMAALILWLTLGSRAAAAEVFVELALGLLLYAGTRAGARPVWRSTR
jgi:hypothetical protein